MARLAGTAALILAASGCLVNNEEFNQAQRRKEALWTELSKLRQDNDQLTHEINRLYSDREILSGHVAMTMAVALHNRIIAEVRPAAPPPAPAPAARPATARPAGPQTPRPGTGVAQSPPPAATANTPPPQPVIRNRPSGAVDWGQ
jgi:hypothetical protein